MILTYTASRLPGSGRIEAVATLRVNPAGIELDLLEGETLLDGAERMGYSWPTICGGVGMCTLCWVEVEEGAENLSEMSQLEANALSIGRGRDGEIEPGVRLGCQVTAHGRVVVHKRGVNEASRAGVYR